MYYNGNNIFRRSGLFNSLYSIWLAGSLSNNRCVLYLVFTLSSTICPALFMPALSKSK